MRLRKVWRRLRLHARAWHYRWTPSGRAKVRQWKAEDDAILRQYGSWSNYWEQVGSKQPSPEEMVREWREQRDRPWGV